MVGKKPIQLTNKKYYINWYPGKKFYKTKKRLKPYVLVENNQPIVYV